MPDRTYISEEGKRMLKHNIVKNKLMLWFEGNAGRGQNLKLSC
jgi:hypothetical protein